MFITGPPSTPVGPLSATDIDGTELTLSWQPPEHDGGSPLTGYFIEKREGRKAFWAKVATIGPEETKYRVKDLTVDTDYAFRVTAENKNGSSKPLEMGEQVTVKKPITEDIVPEVIEEVKAEILSKLTDIKIVCYTQPESHLFWEVVVSLPIKQ